MMTAKFFSTREDAHRQGALAWYRHWVRAQLTRTEAKVPCGDCTACCRSFAFTVLHPEAEDISGYQTIVDPETGRHVLPKTAEGECIYLVNNRCSIYATRPLACRVFDCRMYIASGHVPSESITAVVEAAYQRFELICKEPGDEDFLLALRLQTVNFISQLTEPMRPGDVEAAIAHALAMWKTMLPYLPAFREEFRKREARERS